MTTPEPIEGDINTCRNCGVRIEFRSTEDSEASWWHRVEVTSGANRGMWEKWKGCRLSAAPIVDYDVDAAAKAAFLAGLPRGPKGDLIPGHSKWENIGPKNRQRHRYMAQAAIDTRNQPQ